MSAPQTALEHASNTALVVAEHNQQVLNPATLCAVTAAQALAATVHVLVMGQQCQAVAQAAAALQGVARVLVADGPALAHPLAETQAAQIVAVAAGYTHIVAAASAQGKNTLPRVAALLDVAAISEVLRIESPNTFVRPIYAGNVLATVQSQDSKLVMTIRATAFEPVATTGGQASVQAVDPVPAFAGSRFVGQEIAQSERPELANAKVVVSGGRALGSAENFAILHKLADVLGAALGASRAAVDAGYAPNDWQVGQTGKVVAPQLYIAVGISGAIQHLAGMKDSKVIVAINKDPDAPIFAVADYGLVGDLFEVVPELTQQLQGVLKTT